MKRALDDISIEEWQKHLALAPIDVITKNLKNTTQYYISIGDENRMDPRCHLKLRVTGLQLPHLHEHITSGTSFHQLQVNVETRVHKCL